MLWASVIELELLLSEHPLYIFQRHIRNFPSPLQWPFWYILVCWIQGWSQKTWLKLLVVVFCGGGGFFILFFFHFKENILGKKCFVANIMHTAHGVCSKENLFKQEASKHSSKTLNVLLNSKQSRNEGRKIDMKGKAVNVMSLLQKLFLILACNLDVNLFCTAHFIYIFSHYLFISWFEVWSDFNGSEKEDLAWNKDVILRGSVRL